MSDAVSAPEPTSQEPAIELRDGDVYRFSYNQATWERAKAGKMGHGDLHWCFDGQLIVRHGLLCDTYWGLTWGGDTGRTFSLEKAQEQGTLTFVCNVNDVEKIRPDEYELYADGDAFNLTHQHGCYKHYVKRRGARKDKERMVAVVNRKVREARSQVESALRDLEWAVRRCEQLTPRIEAGEEPSI